MESNENIRWERLFEAIHELSALISTGPHREDQILERILRSSLLLLEGRFAHLLLLEKERIRRFVLSQEEQGREMLSAQVLPRTPNLVKWIQQEQADALLSPPEIVFEDSITGHTGLDRALPVSLPLRANGRVHGVLMVFPRKDSTSSEDIKILSYLANQAAVVLEHSRLYHRLEVEATTDGLTGLYNYRYFMEALTREIKRAARFSEPFAVVMVDVDNLKEYNDIHGHLAGSSALKEMGRLMKADARDIDVIAKYGGDEFSWILPNTDAEGALVFTQRMLSRVSQHEFNNDSSWHLTISAGISLYPNDGDDPRILLNKADDRLYLAKSEGRNQVKAPQVILSQPPLLLKD